MKAWCTLTFNLLCILDIALCFGNKWSIKISDLESKSKWKLDILAHKIGHDTGAKNLGQVGELKGHYLFKVPSTKSTSFIQTIEEAFTNHSNVEWHKREELLKRVKRRPRVRNPFAGKFPKPQYIVPSFRDPLFNKQWHLRNRHAGGKDCNVWKVWAKNITGKGAVVAIVDDGVEWNHPDLLDNYSPEGSIDLNDNDRDPTPSRDKKEDNKHGTRCAGEVAAVPNSVCGVGIAYGAKFSGIKVLDGPTTDSSEAIAFNKFMNTNDVYSCSWGPEDDGKAVDGPHELGELALKHGVVAGRNGFGSIFVVASGNGGENRDNCNYDGYATSIYTITVGAIDEYGQIPPYAEQCNSMIACTVSSGAFPARSIVTTDWSLPSGNSKEQCTENHSGTSAATPLAAGMIALMLEVRPCLTWRDIQHIMVMTSVDVDHATAWTTNEAGFRHSSIHGFGMLDAWRLVNAAKVWESVDWLTSFSPDSSENKNMKIPCCGHESLAVSVAITKDDSIRSMISTLEHVAFTVDINHFHRGNLQFTFICPSGTKSVIPPRPSDNSGDGLQWTFTTVKCWGEDPVGSYVLIVQDTSRKVPRLSSIGVLNRWSITAYGSQCSSEDILRRRSLLNSAFTGRYLKNFSINCPVGHATDFDVTTALSNRTIKLVTLISCFLAAWGAYYIFEVAVCGPETKDTAEEVETHGENRTILQNQQTFTNSTFDSINRDVPSLALTEPDLDDESVT